MCSHDSSGDRDWTERPWGRWRRLFENESLELRELRIDKGGFSSIHYHATKSNLIIVTQGLLVIRFFDGVWPDVRCIHSQQQSPSHVKVSLNCGVVHQFWAQTDVVAAELSIAEWGHEMQADEIVRLCEAGKGRPEP